ncbi:MAG: hypothetical protein H6819_07035 [Phycisphaerales bacterium]|nr:hypothetical protein [Phycisphaerales bacterium]MCB9855336.1 hypothetical protein [Phycisphaerales bacterium]MCB9862929.1 hypothetical protein [Phycisphaerales bacterium]
MPDPSKLQNALIVTDYEELTHFFSQFVAGRLHLLMVVGDPGVSKSQCARRAVGNRKHLYFETHATPFGMYHQIHENCDVPIIIDDLDHLYKDQATVRLLKSLCNTDATKQLRWASKHPSITRGEVPASFSTRSPVCLIANEWRTVNANVRAIEDRAILIHFKPSAGEVHVRVRDWFKDEEVYGFIEEHLPFITRHSMRHYVKGQQLRQACPDKWQEQLLTIMGLDKEVRVIGQLLRAPEYGNDAERIAVFEARGYGSRATFYRWKKKLGMS